MNTQYNTLKHTPGPWRWELNERQKDVRLVAQHSGQKYVMAFQRWGTQHAQPIFNTGFMVPASELSVIVPGREHHADWFKNIDHPDARLIAAAPELLDVAISAWQLLRPLIDCPASNLFLEQIRQAITKAVGDVDLYAFNEPLRSEYTAKEAANTNETA